MSVLTQRCSTILFDILVLISFSADRQTDRPWVRVTANARPATTSLVIISRRPCVPWNRRKRHRPSFAVSIAYAIVSSRSRRWRTNDAAYVRNPLPSSSKVRRRSIASSFSTTKQQRHWSDRLLLTGVRRPTARVADFQRERY